MAVPIPTTSPPSSTTLPPPTLRSPETTSPYDATIPSERADTTVLSERADVVEVVDGDTLVVRFPDGRTERVRIIGIDAPERDEPGWKDATTALATLVADRTVTLVRDVSDRDRFGRLLRYVEVDGVDVGVELVAGGWAEPRRYPPDIARADLLERAESRVRSGGTVRSVPSTTADAGLPGVAIVAVRFDATGNDNENKNDEWVEIANLTDEPIDLSGWRLEDEGPNHVFVFPAGFVLEPGGRVRIRSGCGEPTATDLYWCNALSAVWNNSGDTATLIDSEGDVIDRRSG